jgi:uncharacterized protein involved in exopolysaccharide biosynthesis
MMEEREKALNFVEVTKICINYRKHILLITLIGVIIGVIVSFLIKPKYEAYTIFYTPANNSISKSLLSENNLENFMSYGDEDQIDQVLEMLNSDNLKDKVINKFNLTEHYGIDTSAKYPKTKTRNQFDSNTEFKRTDNLAIKISVKDEDPILSAAIANFISLSLDSIRTNIQQGRAKQAYSIIKEQYQKKQAEVDSILNDKEKESLANLQIRLESADVDFKAAITQQFLIQRAIVPEKSTYPNKALIVFLFALSSFIIALLTICYLEFLRLKFQ